MWELSLSAVTVWLVALLGVKIAMPGAGYFFAWPLILALAAQGALMAREEIPQTGRMLSGESRRRSRARGPGLGSGRAQILVLAGAAVGVLWLVPVGYLFYLTLGVAMPGLAMLLPALGIGLLVPAAVAAVESSRGWLPAGLALAAAVLLGLEAFTPAFDDRDRRPNEIFYVLNGDTGEAFWATTDKAPDDFVSRFLGDEPEAVSSDVLLPSSEPEEARKLARDRLWRGPATAVLMGSPALELLPGEESDQETGGPRTIRFRLRSPRRAEYLNLAFERSAGIVSAKHNGAEVEIPDRDAREGWWRWRYFALPPEGIVVELEVESAGVTLRVAEVGYGWPAAHRHQIPERPAHMMRRPYSWSDSTVVTRTFTLAARGGGEA